MQSTSHEGQFTNYKIYDAWDADIIDKILVNDQMTNENLLVYETLLVFLGAKSLTKVTFKYR